MVLDVEIQTSESMSQYESPLGSNDDRLIRVPAELREKLGLETGLFLCLKSNSRGSIPLQVALAYIEDAEKNDRCAYVSEDTYKQLSIRKKVVNSLVKPADDILIGADPEFFLVDKITGGNISAGHFFPHYGEVGNDCGLAELRPRPGFNEYEVTSNLNTLMVKAYSHLDTRTLYKDREIDMVAASMLNGATAGFHIHFGLPQILLKGTSEAHRILQKMVTVLDYYVGIPAILPEGSEDFQRRSKEYSRYGKPGDHRADELTLEYRVPGGHLLRHPLLTMGILGIGTVTMKDLLSRIKASSNGYKDMYKIEEYKDMSNLYPRLPAQEEVYHSVVSHKTDKAVSHTMSIMKDISNMIGYRDRSKVIIDYFDYILAYIKHGKKFGGDIAYNWRLKGNER